MATTFLGYEVASPERQRKTALAIIGVVGVLVVAGVVALYAASRGQHAGRALATATITSFDIKCRYVVRNISRRASYYDHTGYIDCETAHEVAKANNSVLGSVQKATLAVVEFTAPDGSPIRSHVELGRKEPASVGERVQILYRIDNPSDLREYVRLPFGFGRSSDPQPETEAAAGRADATAPPKPRPSDAYAKSTLTWVGLATFVVALLLAWWLIKGLYRAIRWLAIGPSTSTQPIEPVAVASVARGRLETVARRGPDGGFGRRLR